MPHGSQPQSGAQGEGFVRLIGGHQGFQGGGDDGLGALPHYPAALLKHGQAAPGVHQVQAECDQHQVG
jgi:hypothetical protein